MLSRTEDKADSCPFSTTCQLFWRHHLGYLKQTFNGWLPTIEIAVWGGCALLWQKVKLLNKRSNQIYKTLIKTNKYLFVNIYEQLCRSIFTLLQPLLPLIRLKINLLYYVLNMQNHMTCKGPLSL